jgi:hypothetical protein
MWQRWASFASFPSGASKNISIIAVNSVACLVWTAFRMNSHRNRPSAPYVGLRGSPRPDGQDRLTAWAS